MKKAENEKKTKNMWGNGVSIGLCLGVVYGVAFDKLALGIALGLCFGSSGGIVIQKIKDKIKDEQQIPKAASGLGSYKAGNPGKHSVKGGRHPEVLAMFEWLQGQ